MHAHLVRTCLLLIGLAAPAAAQNDGLADALLIQRRYSNSALAQADAPKRETLFFRKGGPGFDGARPEAWTRERITLPPQADVASRPGRYRSQAWDQAFDFLTTHRAQVDSQEIINVEPDIALPDRRKAVDFKAGTRPLNPAADTSADYSTGLPAMPFWSNFFDLEKTDGHLGASFSQLKAAYEKVAATHPQPARIALLDIGFLKAHRAFPAGAEPAVDVADPNRPSASGNPGEPYFPPKSSPNGVAHGTATAAILAGRLGVMTRDAGKVNLSGGNPDAMVIPIRIGHSVAAAPLPVYFSSVGDIAKGFDAAVARKAEILSMSIGGIPSRALADAVENAYLAGTVLVCATGDYVKFRDVNIVHSPSYVVYPAAYENVLAVAGVTAAGKPYALPESGAWEASSGTLTLGSFGPVEKMRNAICGWGPNVPWAALPAFDPATYHPATNPWAIPGGNWLGFDLDGGGTSACTPQVAAAASLVLEYRRAELAAKYPQPWQRVEAIYAMLQSSAAKSFAPSDTIYFGNGFLKALDALNAPLPDPAALKQHHAASSFYWIRILLSSFWRLPDQADLTPAGERSQYATQLGLLLPRFAVPPGAARDYPAAVLSGIETEIAQVIDQNTAVQEWIGTSLDQVTPTAHHAAFIDLLLQQELSHVTREFLTAVRAKLSAPPPNVV